MVTPAYVDVSHFRAPYKNAYFGQEAPPPSPLPAPPLSPPQAGLEALLEKKDGMYHFRPEVAAQIRTMLRDMRYEFVGGPANYVRVVPLSEAELEARAAALATGDPGARAAWDASNAALWVEAQLKAGKVVLAPTWFTAPVPDRYVAAMPASEKDQIRQATSTPYYVAILASGAPMTVAGLSLTTLVIAGAVVLGAAALIGARARKKGSIKEAFSFR